MTNAADGPVDTAAAARRKGVRPAAVHACPVTQAPSQVEGPSTKERSKTVLRMCFHREKDGKTLMASVSWPRKIQAMVQPAD